MNNVVGKILIVLQLVFSLCFMCFAGAAYTFHEGWKKKADTLQSKLGNTEQQLSEQQSQRQQESDNLKGELTAMTTRAQMAEAKVTGIETSLTQALGNLANAEQQRDRHLADLAIAQQEAQARIAETTDARSENLRLNDRVVDGISVRRTLEDDLLDRQGRIDEAVQRELQMVEELARLRGLLRTNKIDPNDAIVGPVPAPVEKITGVVTAAKKNESRSAELVEISIGSDDGIAKGMRLIVYRGAKYICEIEITEIYPDLSVGRVIESTRNGNIEREDNVTTKL
ncbi:MAG: hypothetical protein DWH78_14395 [Planctomycetota bacterium]|jgi:hypothetical protein|nr:MAG: hypothetical protein DWH78_14395 [Planctomycetota bacterium]